MEKEQHLSAVKEDQNHRLVRALFPFSPRGLIPRESGSLQSHRCILPNVLPASIAVLSHASLRASTLVHPTRLSKASASLRTAQDIIHLGKPSGLIPLHT